MTENVRGDPVADALLRRFASFSPLETSDVARPIVRAIERGRRTLVLPRLAAPLHHLGALPTRLVDGLLLAIPTPDPAEPNPHSGGL